MQLKDKVSEILGKSFGTEQRLSGACTHEVYLLSSSSSDKAIVKTGSHSPDAYSVEAKSLEILSKAEDIRTPDVLHHDNELLILEYIEAGSPSPHSFNKGLKSLHQLKNAQPGLAFDNYLGHFRQKNSPSDWPDFYYAQRLFPLYKACYARGFTDNELEDLLLQIKEEIKRIAKRTENYCLLHGDLWSGNYFYDRNGTLVFIDPAVYYGDPLCDFAMLDLFGGHERNYYSDYINSHRQKISLYKSYYLLYHLLDCGTAYLSQTKEALRYALT